jgi:hypothetical protein
MLVVCAFIPVSAALIGTPGTLGETYGIKHANRLSEEFAKGCKKANVACVTLRHDGAEIAKGFRIVQSADRIALYLDGVTKEYALADYSLETVLRTTPSSVSPPVPSTAPQLPSSTADAPDARRGTGTP